MELSVPLFPYGLPVFPAGLRECNAMSTLESYVLLLAPSPVRFGTNLHVCTYKIWLACIVSNTLCFLYMRIIN